MDGCTENSAVGILQGGLVGYQMNTNAVENWMSGFFKRMEADCDLIFAIQKPILLARKAETHYLLRSNPNAPT